MKRGGPLRRGKPMRRTRMTRSHVPSAYRARERDFDRMGFVKTMTCSVVAIPPPWCSKLTECIGIIEADHMGARGLSHKAADDTVAPLCTGHHRERTDGSGTFKKATKELERPWRELCVARARAAWDLFILSPVMDAGGDPIF